MRDMEAFLTSSQQSVSGEVEVVLNPYHFSINGIKSPHDLMNAKFGSYGEVNTYTSQKFIANGTGDWIFYRGLQFFIGD